MTRQVEYKGKQFTLKEMTYGKWRQLLKLRKQANDTEDEYVVSEALDGWLKATTNATDADISSWTLGEISQFIQKVSEEMAIPLQPSENSDEQLSQTIQP